MSIHLRADQVDLSATDVSDGSSESDQGDQDETWSDWIEPDSAEQSCKSLFDDTMHLSVADALAHDKDAHDVDLDAICVKLSLDFHARARLINYIRRQRPAPVDVNSFTGQETFFASDEFLMPAMENDPLLLHSSAWSDDDDDEAAPADLSAATRRIRALENKLAQAQRALTEYRDTIRDRLDVAQLALSEPGPTLHEPVRDDDSSYFESYGANDIHAVMIQDKVRTSTYASFVLTSPACFRDAVVLDVGCGTGILSLFCAQAGAKRVYAVDASGVARKARQIVKANGFEDVITVIQGKVEEVTIPEKVDIIVSEWMGYALLYESMLDSVLRARDRFLKFGGLLAPSQARMLLALCSAEEIHKERIAFWGDVYGFDMCAMAEEVYDEAVVDVVGPEAVLSAPDVIKDLYLNETTVKDLEFSAPFTLTSTTGRKTKVHALVLYFDIFFNPVAEPVPPETQPTIVRAGSAEVAEVWQMRRRPSRRASASVKASVQSFSTGPQSVPTHWKQTLFLLREPIAVDEGTVVSGSISVHKSKDNMRELDVEIQYTVREVADAPPASDVVVQVFKIR